jgi:hypothetical protein
MHWKSFFLSAIALSAIILAVPIPSGAFHDQGYPCYQCHSLKPSELRPMSRAIRIDENILGTIPTFPSRTSLPLPGTGGYPVSCDFCHRSGSDVPTQKMATKARKHPVDLIQTGDLQPADEITCNDCHDGGPQDLTPATLLTKNNVDGYPDHKGVDNVYAHNLVNNPPHLTQPYWGATLPGVDRAADTAFWTGVRAGSQGILCWQCHDGVSVSKYTQVRSAKAIKGDYTRVGNTGGHQVRSAVAGALGAGSALPCHDCHDSHGSVNNGLIRDGNSVYSDCTSRLATTAYTQASRPYNDLVVCAGCHDTGLAGTAAGTRVEGLAPVDPFNSTGTASLHVSAGIADNMLGSTKNCLAANNGCHATAHDPSVSCVMCHAPGGTGPTVVWPLGNRPSPPAGVTAGAYGSHVVALKTDGVTTSTDWTAQCNKCHAGHSAAVRIPLPPSSWNDPSGRLTGANMRVRLGLDNYAVDNGISLGGSATGGTTEAEICWNCHQQAANSVSEWGINTKLTPAGYPVVLATSPGSFPTLHDGNSDRDSFGYIYSDNGYTTRTSDWTAGYFMDEYDNAIRRRVSSVHTTSFDPAGQSSSVAANVKADNTVNYASPTVEGRSYIRCSNCHDVHDLNKAANDSATGKPFLRGSWMNNPYPPDLPPRGVYSYPTGTPRNRSTNRERGGYFIDQNSGWPTENPMMNTLDKTAGLCTLCHGTNVDTMDFYTGSSMWRTATVNGHSNSTLGGSRSNARDLFSGSRGNPTYSMGEQMYVGGEPCLGTYYRNCVPACGGCCSVLNNGWYEGLTTPNLNTCTGYDGDYANWFGTGTIGGAQGAGSMAHKFTCSKCHTPHAAGLPVLLVHNCIDTVLSTPSGINPADTRAVNCHRKTSPADGWHKLAPGQ